MTTREAAERARTALQNADAQRLRVGVGPLDAEGHTWSDWEQLLLWRITLAFQHGRPDMEALELAGGFVLAAMIALDRAETADPSTGVAA